MKNQVSYKVNGGGRIDISQLNKKISVYGHSKGNIKLNIIIIYLYLAYGLCNHSISVDIIKKHYPDFEISWSNEGY